MYKKIVIFFYLLKISSLKIKKEVSFATDFLHEPLIRTSFAFV